jgi:hypothetical protein
MAKKKKTTTDGDAESRAAVTRQEAERLGGGPKIAPFNPATWEARAWCELNPDAVLKQRLWTDAETAQIIGSGNCALEAMAQHALQLQAYRPDLQKIMEPDHVRETFAANEDLGTMIDKL